MDSLILCLIPLLIQVEGSGNDSAIGDNGRAVGVLQIWKITVDDVNRISGKSYTYADRLNREKSIEMCRISLLHYGKHYEKTTGKRVTMEVLSRNWNGSPVNGYKNPKTLKYWRKCEKLLMKGK